MTTDSTELERIQREGRAAQVLLDDPEVQSLLTAMEATAVAEWKVAPDAMRREQLWTEVAVIGSFRDNLRVRVERLRMVEAQQLRAAGGSASKAEPGKKARAERW